MGSECLKDDKFGSAILIAGAALLQSDCLVQSPLTSVANFGILGLSLFPRLPPRVFSGLTSEPKSIHWAAMHVVVIITSVKTMWHSISGDLTRCFRNPCGESGMEWLGLLWIVATTHRCLGGTLWYPSEEQ